VPTNPSTDEKLPKSERKSFVNRHESSPVKPQDSGRQPKIKATPVETPAKKRPLEGKFHDQGHNVEKG
jgi:hypothetical protein